jgi:hypothetical protein
MLVSTLIMIGIVIIAVSSQVKADPVFDNNALAGPQFANLPP